MGDTMDLDVVLIDGRSGSGKTQLASRIAEQFVAMGRPPQVLHVEDLYPGWDGLAAGSAAVAPALHAGGYRAYDWVAEAFGEWRPLERRPPLIIEGCGAITRATLAAAQAWATNARVHSVWLECAAAIRKQRALARDGDTYAPHWERWAAQEDAQYAEHRPWDIADNIVHAG